MTDVMETSLPLLDPESGLACWVIGDVNGMNLAEEVWTKVTSKVAVRINGEMAGYRLLGIVEDEIEDSEKVTRIWNSESDKSGKATPKDRILIVCRDTADPRPKLANEGIRWSPMMV